MGSGVSVPQSINIVITEEIKNSTKIKIDDIKDYQAEVARLRQKLAEGYGIIEKETERLAEIARRVDTGKVKMIYQQYQELFPIENGKINVEKIDEDYCLSDVMPGCKLALLNNMTLEAMHKLEMSDLPIPFQPFFFAIANLFSQSLQLYLLASVHGFPSMQLQPSTRSTFALLIVTLLSAAIRALTFSISF